MRALRDNQDCVCVCPQLSSPNAGQHSLISNAQEVWKDWEIQCLVLVSFSLQVFLLFSAVFRRRYRSVVLSALLWLAYLSADSVAIYLLGRLTLLVGDDRRQQLVLFWAPFLLLHLGGQDTITAFSMEDCALWKRHLLNLTIQVTLAIYVIGKQWRGDKQMVAPTVLMFVAGMARYMERILALRRAQSKSLESSPMEFHVSRRNKVQPSQLSISDYYIKISSIISNNEERNFKQVMHAATMGFGPSLEFLMDRINPRTSSHYLRHKLYMDKHWTTKNNLDDLAYKLAEIQLSMIYDYLYTKFGGDRMGVLCRLATFALTCIALALFVVSRLDDKGSNNYHRTNVTISYLLLVGAITLEISSGLLWLMSSYSPWNLLWFLPCADPVMYTIVSRRESSRVEWSGKLQQHNMIDGCNQERRAGQLKRTMRRVGIERDCIKPVKVSTELKKVLFDKMLQIGECDTSIIGSDELALTRFRGRWAQVWLQIYSCNRHDVPTFSSTSDRDQALIVTKARQALDTSQIQKLDFVTSVFVWHLVTDMCLEAANTKDDEESTAADHDDDMTTNEQLMRNTSRELSNYVVYLVVKRQAMLGRSERHNLSYYQELILQALRKHPDKLHRRRELVAIISDGGRDTFDHVVFNREGDNVFRLASEVSSQLLLMEAVATTILGNATAEAFCWELITMVWVEMLCYIARNCGGAFHAKQLCDGGEFVTHVKMLLFILHFPV